MFNQFDIDYDKVTLDGSVLNKPKYISTSQWLSFWESSSSEEYESELEKSYQRGLEENEKEHEIEIDRLKDSVDIDILKLKNNIDPIILSNEYSNFDKEYYISKEFHKLLDKIWQ